jgi:hypothetical protein
MKRLLPVALGVALCTLTTTVEARQGHVIQSEGFTWTFGGASNEGANALPERRRSAQRRGKTRAHARSGNRRYVSKYQTQKRGRTGVANRGLVSYARGGASRACLTPAARALLGRIEGQFGAVQVISTCRPGARIAGTGRISRHASGNAIDFNAGPRKGAIVRWLIANHRSGGTMTYAGMSHIHVDIGPRFVSLNSGGRRYRN